MTRAVAGKAVVLSEAMGMSWFKRLLASAYLLAVVPAVVAQGAPGSALPVSVIEVRATSVPSSFEVTGQAEGAKETEVRARVNGILLKRLFVEGAAVKAGDPLFQIDPVPFQNALDEAQARAKQTEREAARLKKLYSQQAVSRKEFDDATSLNEIAQATLKTAKLNLAWTTVTAPVDGISGRSLRSEGHLITSTGDAGWLTSIYQVDPIWVRFGLSSADAAQLPTHLLENSGNIPVQLLLGNGQVYDQPGKLNFRSVFIDPKLGTQQLRAEFPNPQRKILPGQFLRVKITTGSLDNVFLVPQRAVVQNERGYMVWTVGSDNKVIPTPLKMGQWSGSNWVVLSGLKPGDRVVVDQIIKLRPGALVNPTVVPLEVSNPGSKESR